MNQNFLLDFKLKWGVASVQVKSHKLYDDIFLAGIYEEMRCFTVLTNNAQRP